MTITANNLYFRIGFIDASKSKIQFDATNRLFTIQPEADFYQVLFLDRIKTFTETLQIELPDQTGVWFVAFDQYFNLTVIYEKIDIEHFALISYIYWSAEQKKALIIGDERHGASIDIITHKMLHNTIGATLCRGFSMNNYSLIGDGKKDEHCYFVIDGGSFWDEDIEIKVIHYLLKPKIHPLFSILEQKPFYTMMPVYYRKGVQGDWFVADHIKNAPLICDTQSVYFNHFEDNQWKLCPIIPSYYFSVWILVTHHIKYPIIAILGQHQHPSFNDELKIGIEEQLVFGPWHCREQVLLYKLVYQATYSGNQYHSALRQVIDFRVLNNIVKSVLR